MHKTKTGRWQPDPEPKGSEPLEPLEPVAVHDQSFEMYTIHRYSHMLCDRHPNCPWCSSCPVCLGLDQGNPFAVISQLGTGFTGRNQR